MTSTPRLLDAAAATASVLSSAALIVGTLISSSLLIALGGIGSVTLIIGACVWVSRSVRGARPARVAPAFRMRVSSVDRAPSGLARAV